MSKAEPTIQKYMTCQPHFVDMKETVVDAQKTMKDLKIRHLPVMDGRKVIGIISERDINNALSFVGADAGKMKVQDIEHEHPYVTEPDTPLHRVVDQMAENRFGCAIVIQNDKLVGIFTTVDVCRALSSILQTRFHQH